MTNDSCKVIKNSSLKECDMKKVLENKIIIETFFVWWELIMKIINEKRTEEKLKREK